MTTPGKEHTRTLRELGLSLAGEYFFGDGTVELRDIVYDSRQGKPGDVFVALRSRQHDGHDFITDAYERGVRCFVVEQWPPTAPTDPSLTVLCVADTRLALAVLSAAYFGWPAEKLRVVALTGTKGKTTTSYLIKAICEAAGVPTGVIGSNGISYPAAGDPRAQDGVVHEKLPNTTPESHELQRVLADMVAAGVSTVVLEATSQGFLMRRTDGIRFAVGVYTNISPDHISALEHASFEEYFACKKRIFGQSDICVVNRDAELYDQIVDEVTIPIRTYGLTPLADYAGEMVDPGHAPVDTAISRAGLSQEFTCRTSRFADRFAVGLPGQFSASNALAAIAVADLLGLPRAAIHAGLASIQVPGRTEVLDVPAPYTVMIDFAHNKLSMEALIEAVRAYEPRHILTVFGLEGNRSHARRFDCGEIIGRSVDYTILADASPRDDDPEEIVADIASGIEQGGGKNKYEIIHDRRLAIPKILDLAGPGDMVLLIGKGNVRYEEIHGVNHPFDERAVVREYFTQK